MIVRMEKITIVIKSSWMDEVLRTLGKIGTVHLQPVIPPENSTIEELEESIQLMEKAISIIPKRSDKGPSRYLKEKHGLALAEQLLGLADEVKHLEEEISMLEIEYERLKVWGRFGPEEISGLKDAGILMKLFRCRKSELRKIPKKFSVNIISEDGPTLYLAIVSKKKDFNIPLEEIEIPVSGMDEIENMIETKSAHLQYKRKEISNLYDKSLAIKQALMESREILVYEEAKAGVGREDEISRGDNGPDSG